MENRDQLPKLLLAMPLPPPYSGQETITQMLLASPLQERFRVFHLDTGNKTSNINRGRLDWHNTIATLRNLSRLLWLLWKEQPDIVSIPMAMNKMGFIKFGAFALPCAWLGAKVVSRCGGSHFDKFYEAESPWMRAFVRYTLDHVAAVIVRADRLKYMFEPFMRAERIWTVYLGLDTNMFSQLSDRVRDRAGVNVLYLGHVSKAKGALDLLEAIPFVLDKYPDTRFRFAGEIFKQERNITFIENPDDIGVALTGLIDNIDINGAVELLGPVTGEAKLRVFTEADIFVFPSYAEGFGFAVLEAMLAGKAVVATRVGALPEVFDNEIHLLFVEPGDVEGIARSIVRLIEDVELRDELGQTAREIVEQQYNLKSLANRMETVFRSVLEGEAI